MSEVTKEKLDDIEEYLNEFALELKKENEEFQKNKVHLEVEKNEFYKNKAQLEAERAEFEGKFKVELDSQKRIKLAEYESKISEELTKKYEVRFKGLTDEYLKRLEETLKKEAELKKEQQELEIKKANLDSQIKAKEAELEKDFKTRLDDEYIRLASEYENKLSDEFYKNFKDRINKLEQKEKEYLDKSDEIQIRESKLEAQENGLKEEQEYYKNNIEQEYKNKIDRLEEDKKWWEDRYRSLEQEYRDLAAERDEYTINIEDRDLIDERNKKEEELERAKKKIGELESEKNKQRNEFESKLEEIREEREAQQIEIELNGELKNEIESLKKQLEIYENRLQDDEYWKDRYNAEHQRLEEFKTIYLGKGEQKNRAEAISQEFYKEIELENNNKIDEKDEIKWLEDIQANMKKYGVEYPERLLYAFHTTLKSATMSPLSVLSGVSGTGKSELPKLYSYFGGFNFLAEAVQPTWDSPASMMGFYNMIEGKFDSTNILRFLIQTSFSAKFKDPDCINSYGLKESMNLILLDEINLAHIELYFAEFLSKFEARRGNNNVNLNIQIGTGMDMPIRLDTNLLWVGTMNEDETTKNLSDKVLDRAYCLKFPRPTKLIDRPKVVELSEVSDFKWLPRETWQGWLKSPSDFDNEQKKILEKFREQTDNINEALKSTDRAIGHRVWQSMEFYIANHPQVIKDNDKKEAMKKAYEDQLVQKIMPKLRGIETSGEERKALEEIKEIIKDTNLADDFKYALENPYGMFKFNSADYLEK